jgi:serine acetyltransferase
VGARCLIAHPVGVVIFGTLGEDVSVCARAIVAPALHSFRLDQAPQIGHRVVLGAMSSVIGNVEIASGVHVAPCSLVDFSIDTPGHMVKAHPLRPAHIKSARQKS